MREIRKATVKSFVEYVTDEYLKEYEKHKKYYDFEGVNIVAKYDVIMPILNELIKESPFMLVSAEISDVMWDGYDKEFCLSVNHDGEVFIEKAYLEEKDVYLYIGDGLTFIHNDCNSKFLQNNTEAEIVAFEIGEKTDTCSDESCDCEAHCWDDDDMHGFTKSVSNEDGFHSISFYSTNKDLVEKALEVFNE